MNSKSYYEKNKNSVLNRSKNYYIKNKEKCREYQKKWREENKELCKKWREENKDKIKEDRIKRSKTEKYIKKRKERLKRTHKNKYENDLQYKLRHLLRRRVGKVFKKNKIIKSENTLNLLGCSLDELKKHIESQFKEGMTWENHGLYGWHLDHIIPCSAFDLTDPEQQKKCFNYKNLQPLWAKDNLLKGSKII